MMEGQFHHLDMAHNTYEDDMTRIRDEEFVSTNTKSGSENQEGGSGDEQDSRPKRKRYHRHTQHQIQEMEAFFKECLHQITSKGKRPTAIGEMSFDEHHLRLENTRWRAEINRISAVAARYAGKPGRNYPVISPPMPPRPVDLSVENFKGKPSIRVKIFEVGDLLRSIGVPIEAEKPIIIELAINSLDGIESVLNEDEYTRIFPHSVGPKPVGFKCEASGESAVKLSTRVARNYNGTLQVMTAEFQLPTPLVPTRESYYVRYYKQHADGTWVVVDVSLDNIHPSPTPRCRRRPSRCLIQEMPNGYSKAKWWVATLDRQYERLTSAMTTNIPVGDASVITNSKRKKEVDDVGVMTSKSVDDPGRPSGIVLSAATSSWLPVPPKGIFDFLRDENTRNE
ncbi:hypothetical protein SADUNF_Sadunf13G0064000 [Salix dunnii]|uniref:START domain-containing protein n=1 Tax=Salix dunnii TaxID=1413687 RepID=A0A835JFS6_9ROSI|nr:hypothetical protein SADUNF_Sadunf13G0064000 [Salix dunnii]